RAIPSSNLADTAKGSPRTAPCSMAARRTRSPGECRLREEQFRRTGCSSCFREGLPAKAPPPLGAAVVVAACWIAETRDPHRERQFRRGDSVTRHREGCRPETRWFLRRRDRIALPATAGRETKRRGVFSRRPTLEWPTRR